jgi:hypothetical protein
VTVRCYFDQAVTVRCYFDQAVTVRLYFEGAVTVPWQISKSDREFRSVDGSVAEFARQVAGFP